MLNWTSLIKNVKNEIGWPHAMCEFDDSTIQDYLEENTLSEFSQYFPDSWSTSFETTGDGVSVENRTDLFYIPEPDGLEILSVDQFIPNQSGDLMMGHPIRGVLGGFENVKDFALGAFNANNTRPFSEYNYTIKFMPPNILRILPTYTGRICIEYSRQHNSDLSTIQPDLQMYFKRLCIAKFLMWIGATRSNYSNVSTPFGEIPLQGDTIYSRGEQMYQTLIEKFETGSSTFIIFDKG